MDHDRFLDVLARQNIGAVRRNELLREYSRWRIGGPEDFLVEPHCIEHIQAVLECTRNSHIPLVIIGDGCNLLFSDEGIRGVVMKIGRWLSRVSIQGSRVRAEAGAWIPSLARVIGAAGLVWV